MRYFTRPLGPEPRRRTLSFAGFITKTVRLYRGASSSRKTLLRNLFREPFTVLARLASGPLVNSYRTYHKKGRAKKRSSHREYNQIQTGIALSSDEKRAPKFLSEFFFYTVINRHDSKVSQFLYYTHAYTVSDMDRLVRPFRNVYKSQIPYASKILLPAGFPRCPLIHLRNRCPQTVFMDTIKL